MDDAGGGAGGGLGLSHYPASPEAIEAQAEAFKRLGQQALDTEKITSAAFDPAVAS